MKSLLKLFTLGIAMSFSAVSLSFSDSPPENHGPAWQSGVDTEVFWQQYIDAKGGLTWGRSSEYPEYEKVKEGDLFMVEVKQGPCLMEFFHNRWRRANDVRRWDDSVNQYGGCPNVFD